MKSSLFLLLCLLLNGATASAQAGKTPLFSASDSLNVFGPWQTTNQLTTKGKQKDELIPISYRHRVLGKRMMTCRYTVELRNDSPRKIQFYYLAGNDRTNGFAGGVGAIREKVDLEPGKVKVIDYILPTRNFKADTPEQTCKGCKELNHALFLGDLEAK